MTAGTRYLVVFRKGPEARFLSHLDLQATLEYAMRRAGLPVELSEGFNPRPRYSLVAALPLGYLGEQELLELTLREPLIPNDVGTRLAAALPDGIEVMEVEQVLSGASAASRLRSATYRIVPIEPVPDLEARCVSLLARATVEIEEERSGAVRRRDIRPLILSLVALPDGGIRLTVRLTTEGSVRPDEVVRTLGLDPIGVTVTRESIEIAPLPPGRAS